MDMELINKVYKVVTCTRASDSDVLDASLSRVDTHG